MKRCGIVGLPNVGKSTFFNVVSKSSVAEAANYAFCTIEPNIAVVDVEDERLEKLAKLANSRKIVRAQLELCDIAGLVAGASSGEGLGNKFLSHIQSVDMIIHVVRCFDNSEIEHVHNRIDPINDIQVVELELILKDFDAVEKRIQNIKKSIKRKSTPEFEKELSLLEEVHERLSKEELPFRKFSEKERKMLDLLTVKPMLYLCNVAEDNIKSGNSYSKSVHEFACQRDMQAFNLCISTENDLMSSNEEERVELLEILEIEDSAISQLVSACYLSLHQITFFTVGETETRAWTVSIGSTAPQASGAIHSDFEKGFIKAEVISFDDYIKHGSEEACKSAGVMNLVGKDYIVQDGDVMHFIFN